MFNLDSITNENNKEHNGKWPFIPDHPNRILIIGGSGLVKTNTLLNLIKEQDDIDKIYLMMKFNNRKELQNIALNHSAGIDYKDFVKIYRECTKKPYSFLTIDTMLPASDPLRFRKNLLSSYKNGSN